MKCLVLCLILLAYSCEATLRLTLAPSTTMDAAKMLARSTYVKAMNQLYFCREPSSGTYVSEVQHTDVPTNVYSLDVVFYAKTSSGLYVDPPKFEKSVSNSKLSLYVTYTAAQLTEAYGCRIISDDTNYVIRLCTFRIDYIATELGQAVETVNYTMSIKLSKTVNVVATMDAKKIMLNGCDCEIVTSIAPTLSIYTDEACTIPLTTSSVTYGTKLCLKLSSDNDLVKSNYYLSTTMLTMTYTDSTGSLTTIDILPITTQKCSNTATCSKGQTFSVFEMVVVGTGITFNQVAVLKSSTGARLLVDAGEGRGLKASSTQTFSVSSTGTVTPSNPTGTTNSASSLLVSILTVLGVILMLI